MSECPYAECPYAECHFAECHYAECHYAECHYAERHLGCLSFRLSVADKAFILSNVMLNVVAPPGPM